jgi:DNA-binding transcriptional MerR regulator
MPARNNEEQRYGIGAVARLTGLSEHTIRAWERRYGAVVAARKASGHREYSPEDVDKLGLLKCLTDDGIGISSIAGESIDELRQRVQDISVLTRPAPRERVSVAVLGENLPGQLAATNLDLAPLDIVIADSSTDRFEADLRRQSPDVIVLERPVLDGATVECLSALLEESRAGAGVVVYHFAASRDIERARDANLITLRAPVEPDQLCAAVVRTLSRQGPRAQRPHTTSSSKPAQGWHFAGPIAPRRFTQQQLTLLSLTSTTIDCECPHHLAQLVADLSAFEIYSANCANRDEEDAALHRFLHKTTADARAMVELALEKVAEAEGLDY